jgi:hypothetical protein
LLEETLARHRGVLVLDNLETLSSAELARKLTGDGRREFGRLRELFPPAAAVLAEINGTLFLNGLESLSAETAAALAKHAGDLSLNGLRTIPTPVAQALAAHRGDLSLAGLDDPTPPVVQALADHMGPVFTARPVTR